MQRSVSGSITGWGAYTPERVVTNHELSRYVDASHEWIVQRSGIHQRHVAAEDETLCSLALHASRAALEKADLPVAELDLILVATTVPDDDISPLSCALQAALGGKNTPGFVFTIGCAGWVYALNTAYQFIQSGAYRNILVVGVDMPTRFIDWRDRTKNDPAQCVLFGDGAGAVVIQATDQPCGLLGFTLGADGSRAQYFRWGTNGQCEMNGPGVFRFATRTFGPACYEALAQAGLTLDDIDWIIPHQANLRIIESAARRMGVPLSKFVVDIADHANTCTASIPIALSNRLDSGAIQPTDRVLFVGFGAGLAWAAAAVQLQPLHWLDQLMVDNWSRLQREGADPGPPVKVI